MNSNTETERKALVEIPAREDGDGKMLDIKIGGWHLMFAVAREVNHYGGK